VETADFMRLAQMLDHHGLAAILHTLADMASNKAMAGARPPECRGVDADSHIPGQGRRHEDRTRLSSVPRGVGARLQEIARSAATPARAANERLFQLATAQRAKEKPRAETGLVRSCYFF
jgi:hypothetical protein